MSLIVKAFESTCGYMIQYHGPTGSGESGASGCSEQIKEKKLY